MFRLIIGLILVAVGFVTLKWVFGVVLSLLLWGAVAVVLLGVGVVVTKVLTTFLDGHLIWNNNHIFSNFFGEFIVNDLFYFFGFVATGQVHDHNVCFGEPFFVLDEIVYVHMALDLCPLRSNFIAEKCNFGDENFAVQYRWILFENMMSCVSSDTYQWFFDDGIYFYILFSGANNLCS